MIIDFLYSNGRALANCSLVHSSWLPSSRYHYFRRIRDITRRNLEHWLELLDAPNTFPLCIRRLSIESLSFDQACRAFTHPRLLPTLTELSLRSITFGDFTTPALDRHDLSHIRTLTISSCSPGNQPEAVFWAIQAFTSLTYLRLTSTWFWEPVRTQALDSLDDTPLAIPMSSLRSVQLYLASSEAQLILRWLCESDMVLSELDVSLRPGMSRYVGKLIRSCGARLTKLDLRITDKDFDVLLLHEALDFTSNQNLTLLRLQGWKRHLDIMFQSLLTTSALKYLFFIPNQRLANYGPRLDSTLQLPQFTQLAEVWIENAKQEDIQSRMPESYRRRVVRLGKSE